jgi:hypothetical protein
MKSGIFDEDMVITPFVPETVNVDNVPDVAEGEIAKFVLLVTFVDATAEPDGNMISRLIKPFVVLTVVNPTG